MPKVRDVLAALESIAPTRFAFSFDKVGLQVGNPNADVHRAVVSLDRSLTAVDFAVQHGAQLLLAHHPLIFAPLNKVDTGRHDSRTVLTLAQAGIAFIAAHTNWDSARGGINDALVSLLGLQNPRDFGTAAEVDQFKLVTFVPASHVETLIDGLAAVGAGQIEGYTRCAFRTSGQGTYICPQGTEPENVEEIRLEMVLPGSNLRAALRVLREIHPYEVPAYDLIPLRPHPEQPAGRVGDLPTAMSYPDFVAYVDERLNTKSLAWGKPSRTIRRVAVVGGAADGEWMSAQSMGADVLVTGEVKQHIAVEASESGINIMASGHYATEQPGVVALAERLREALPEVDWLVFEPEPGIGGRPL